MILCLNLTDAQIDADVKRHILTPQQAAAAKEFAKYGMWDADNKYAGDLVVGTTHYRVYANEVPKHPVSESCKGMAEMLAGRRSR